MRCVKMIQLQTKLHHNFMNYQMTTHFMPFLDYLLFDLPIWSDSVLVGSVAKMICRTCMICWEQDGKSTNMG